MMLFILFHYAKSAYLTSKSIEVTVNSSYYETSPFEEGINFFNEFYPQGYSCISQTINSISNIPTDLNGTLNIFSKCLKPFQLNFLSYLLKFNYFSPRIAFYTSIANLNIQGHTSYSFEPQLGCHQFVDFTQKNIRIDPKCVIRPIISNPESRNKRILNGYGVELRPFRYSMEYGVKDSDKIYNSTIPKFKDDTRTFIDKSIDLKSDSKEPSPRRLRKALFSFIDELKSDENDQNNSNSIFKSLRDVSENWPVALSHVGSTEIDKDVEDEENDDDISGFDISPGTNSVTLNGRVIPISTFDPFTFAKAISEETNLISALGNDFSLYQQTIELLSKISLAKPTLSIDIRKLPIKWLNDIEKDKRYKKWSSNLMHLFDALKGLPKIRKNLVNIVLIIDPSFPKDFRVLMSAFTLMRRGYAARFGVLFSPHVTSEKSKKIFFALEEIEQNFSLAQLLSKINLNETDPEKAFSEAFEKLTNKKFDEIDFLNESRLSYLNELTTKLNETGIMAPSLWVNGVLSSGSESFDYLEISAFESLKKLREILTPKFEGDVLDLILQRSKSVTKILPEIHKSSISPIKITQYSYEEMSSFIQFLKKQKYEYEDSEFPLATMWVICENKKELIKEKVKKFFENEHRTPVRIAFFDQIPPEIKSDPQFPQISTSNFDAILIVNGRIILINEDFDGYGQFCDWMSTPEIATIVRKISFPQLNDAETFSNQKELHTFWSIVLYSFDYFDVKRRHFHPNTFDPDSPSVVTSKIEELPLSIEAILDPFSHEFQKMIGFFSSIEELNIADISIRLNPPDKLTKVPSSFYRYVTDKAGVFSYLNESVTYSLLIEAPETWLVEQVVADVDLDNILGSELKDGAYRAIYALKNIIVEGSAVDISNSHCSGAQLVLFPYKVSNPSASVSDNIIADTIVMKNKGYWQLKANAGLFIVKSTNYEMLTETEVLPVASFVWRQHILKLRESSSSQQNNNDVKIEAVDDGKIHIFVVASGHLYERLAKIMMLSAMNHANGTTCKFWFFQNFLSPQLKNTLKMMKNLYNMEYELVTYRWPYWLRRQKEKQRITWGNKILFLDVLFPLNLKRVIYVDADQTIRTNMRELMTMDFGEAPYAFTPFCDSRAETEPYRFWKSGYWKEQLKGKPYHISALFAIDLKKFREISAGDWLRYYYASLAGDSNSLANLDQDLPNYAQERIPIFSLQQNWLWCETWCSDDTMNEAKTIDLCNNPLTKRPKLEIAQTRIDEWPKLDQEARSIEERAMKTENNQHINENFKNDDL